jgi:hypothetical protein
VLQNYLKEIYTDFGAGGGYGSIDSLYRKLKKDGQYNITKPEVEKYLMHIDSYSLHKPIKKKFETQRVIIGGVGELHQSDLMDMVSLIQYNKGYRYVLVVIDCFSKKAWARNLKTKTGQEMTDALSDIYKLTPYPLKFQTDGGVEYYNHITQSFFKRNNVFHFSSFGNTKSQMAERLIRSLKLMIWRYLDYNKTYKYFDILPKLMDEYNNRYHRSIKMSPNEVNEGNEKHVFHVLFGDLEKVEYEKSRPKFRVGDLVRINKWKHAFHKSYQENYTKEIFRIKEVMNTYVTQYRLYDLQYEDVLGKFYQSELVGVIRDE